MCKSFRLIWLWIKLRLQRFNEYRLGAFAWIINGLITPLIMMAIWLVVDRNADLAYNQSQIITYYILTIIISRLTQTWSIDHIGQDIRSGHFSNSLLKPYHYLVEDLGRLMGNKLIRLITLIPLFLILLFVFRHHLQLNLNSTNFFLLIFSLLLGLGLNFYLQNFLATFVFWLEESFSLDMLHMLGMQAFSGNLVPLALAPPLFATLITYTPFRFYISFPIEIVLNQLTFQEVIIGFTLGVLYLFLFFFLHKIMFKLGLKHYGAYGS